MMTSQTEDQYNNTASDTNAGDSNAGDSNAGDSKTSQSGQASQSSQEAGKELIDELTRLGQKFVEVVDIAWNSDQRKKIEDDLRTGLVTVASSLEDGFRQISNSKEAKEAVTAAEEVAEKVRSSKIAIDLSDALAQGLRTLSEQMDKLSSEMKQKSASSPGKSSTNPEAQDIPISRDEE